MRVKIGLVHADFMIEQISGSFTYLSRHYTFSRKACSHRCDRTGLNWTE